MSCAYPTAFRIIIAWTVLLLPTTARPDDFSSYFTGGWQFRQVEGGQVSLCTAGVDYPCHIRAYGWKLLGKERRKEHGDPWYSLGDEWQKWAWKVVAYNPGQKPIKIWMQIRLKSSEGFKLDEISVGNVGTASSPMQEISEALNPVEWIQPLQARVLMGVSSYKIAEHKGEGRPAQLDWSVSCSD